MPVVKQQKEPIKQDTVENILEKYLESRFKNFKPSAIPAKNINMVDPVDGEPEHEFEDEKNKMKALKLKKWKRSSKMDTSSSLPPLSRREQPPPFHPLQTSQSQDLNTSSSGVVMQFSVAEKIVHEEEEKKI